MHDFFYQQSTNFALFFEAEESYSTEERAAKAGWDRGGYMFKFSNLHVIVIDLEFVILIFCIETLPSCVQYQSSVVLNIFVKTFVTFRCFDKPHCLFFYSF